MTKGVSILNALDLIHTVPEIEQRLVDDMSRKIYDIRMEYAIYGNIENYWIIARFNNNFIYINKNCWSKRDVRIKYF